MICQNCCWRIVGSVLINILSLNIFSTMPLPERYYEKFQVFLAVAGMKGLIKNQQLSSKYLAKLVIFSLSFSFQELQFLDSSKKELIKHE